MEVVCEHLAKTPIWDLVQQSYKYDQERCQLSNYYQDLNLGKLKASL